MNPTEASIANDILAYVAASVQPDYPTAYLYGNWIWNKQAPPPNSGQIRSNSGNWSGATLLTIDKRVDSGTDVNLQLRQIAKGDQLKLVQGTSFSLFLVTDVPTWVVDALQVPVAYSQGAGPLPVNGSEIQLWDMPLVIPPNPTPMFGIGAPQQVVPGADGTSIVLYFQHRAFSNPPGLPYVVTVSVTQLNANRMHV